MTTRRRVAHRQEMLDAYGVTIDQSIYKITAWPGPASRTPKLLDRSMPADHGAPRGTRQIG